MKKAFNYRLYPNRSQAEALDAMLETHRRLYNDALAERRDVYESEEHTVSYDEQSGKLKEARRSDPHLVATNFSSTQATLRRLDRTFKAFFRRVKAGEASGYPRFKGRDRFRLVEFPSYGDGCRLKENGRLYLQHIGHIKVKLHRPVEGKIKTVSVKKSCGKWYAIFVCDIGDAPEPACDLEVPAVGIDLGSKSFFATSDGEVVEPPRYYRKAQKKLRRVQRALSRKKKGSNRRRKARERVARLHEKVAHQRRDFHHKEARKLVEQHGLIAHEALGVKSIARTRLAKSTHDAGWAQFVNILAAKAEEAGVRVVAVDPRNTTQTCSNCGDLPEVKKTLSDRIHSCSRGYVTDRDLNAAQNILRLGRSLQDETQRVAAYVS
ncbi:MAG: transposase [Actinobacteria bacterium]|nr:transposase [Actinomycetota bacterium]